MSIDYAKLREPFPADEVQWRIQQIHNTKNGPKATVLAYIDARAVMDRLDDIVGPDCWQDTYTMEGPNIICGIGIRAADGLQGWVWKYDGAPPTDVESWKGGLSDAFKRAAVKWGIFRYGYNLPSTWVDIVKEKSGIHTNFAKSKTKDGTEIQGFWGSPPLPAWALPKNKK